MQEHIEKLKKHIDIQKENIGDEYGKGMYNGMVFSLSVLEDNEPKYLNETECNKNLKICGNCIHYDFEDGSSQICSNRNNLQMINDNDQQEERWYKMMVTPDFCCNEWQGVRR